MGVVLECEPGSDGYVICRVWFTLLGNELYVYASFDPSEDIGGILEREPGSDESRMERVLEWEPVSGSI